MTSSQTVRLWLTCAMAIVVPVSATPQEPSAAKPAPALVARFLTPDANPLVSYRALRRLTASTRGGRMQATLDAWTSLDPEHGFRFEIVAEEGNSLIRRRVLLAALEAEQQATTPADRDQAALNAANYEFLDTSPESVSLVKVGVRPRRKHVMLIEGALFLEPASADLIRVEGELSRRPSFWTRRVRVRRDYERIDGVHVAVGMSSTADVLMVGPSTFSMTYRYLEINGKPVKGR